jgi:rhomboid protease GluP
MYALWYIGLQLEPVLGRWPFLVAYLLAGVVASTNSLWWHELTASAGASGAIFGMYGLFLALLTTNLFHKNVRQPLLASMAVFVGYNLLSGTQEGIDNAAHLGGLIGGLVLGFAYLPSLRDKAEPYLAAATSGVLVMVVAIGVFFSVKYLPNDLATYQQKMEKFVAQEAIALEVYQLPEGSSNESILYGLQERGIYYWRENLKILNTVDKLNLPAHLVERNRLLREYCQIRIRHYRLLYKAIDEETEAYQKQIEHYDRQLGILLKKIKGE